jgi:hypothetical protein
LNGGHYTAMAKNYIDGEWYEFNDHQVSKIIKSDTQKLINNNAYILFYQKRGIDFNNIVDYSKIKNKLQLINGKEKFDPAAIEFPMEHLRSSSKDTVVAKQGSKTQMEMFDEPMLSASSSFREVKYEDKPTYVDWLERELDLDVHFGQSEAEESLPPMELQVVE